MIKPHQEDIDKFVRSWVSANVGAAPDPSDLVAMIDCLSAHLTCDARAKGISGREINQVFGDIDDYLASEYGKMVNSRVISHT